MREKKQERRRDEGGEDVRRNPTEDEGTGGEGRMPRYGHIAQEVAATTPTLLITLHAWIQ